MSQYNQNLNFFKKFFKNIYTTIQNTTPSIQSMVIEKNLSTKIENFISSPTALFVKPSKFHVKYDEINHKEKIHRIHNSYTKLIEDKIPIQESDFNKYHQHLDSLPILIIFGISNAKQIEQLINMIDIKNLIIIDINYSDFKYSMNFTNWEKIIKYFQRDGYSLDFKISDAPITLAHTLLNEIDEKYRQYSYYIPYFASYNNPIFTNILKIIKDKYYLLFNGWGFYDDEKLGFEHSIKNIKTDINILNIDKNSTINYNAFIIGSGPSIDADIEYIKKHQNHAVIFSCGTSLKILEANDIIPDYHIEIERTDFIINVLKETTSAKFRKKIDFIGLSNVAPEVFTYFKTQNIFFKKVDTTGVIIPSYIQKLDHIGPTVINAGISIVSELNFKNIYMFGTDMGYKDEKKHHSKSSAYNQKDSSVDIWKPTTHHITLPANFDISTHIYSIPVYINCKKNIETSIRHHNKKLQKNINFFNCSDGAFIDGTKPLKAKDINLKSNLNKQDSLLLIQDNFIKNTNSIRKDIKINSKKEKLELFIVIDKIVKDIESTTINQSFNIYFNLVNKIFSYFPKVTYNENNTIYCSMLIGDLRRLFLTIYTHSLMSKELDDSFIFIEHSLDKIIEFLIFIKSDLTPLFKEIS